MRGRFSCLHVLVLIGSVSACTPSVAPLDPIRVGAYPTTDMLPVYVMQAEGIAARHGLEIILSEPYAGGLAAAEAIAADEVDVTYPGIVPLLSLASAGRIPADIAVIGVDDVVTAEAPSAALFIGTGVTSWADLSGRQIGIHSLTSINAAAFAARARFEGLTDYEFVVVSLVDMGIAVRDGTVSAAVMEEPWTTQAVIRGDGRILAFMEGEPPLENMPLTAIVVRAELLDSPDLARRYLLAHLESVKFIAEHEAEARALFVPAMGISAEVASRLHLKSFPLDARLDMAAVLALEQLLNDAGAIDTRIDPATFYAPALLESILADGR